MKTPNIPRIPIINAPNRAFDRRKINKLETPKARVLPVAVFVLFSLAGLYQGQEYLLTLAQVKVFVCWQLEANDPVEFSKECSRYHNRFHVGPAFVKINFCFVLLFRG